MVRETRHLWVGNLPHTIREDRILDHFKRYGKVQSVKILPKKDEENGTCATVAFIDIKSAAKAHNADNKIDERTLKTDYYEPPASSTASSAIFIHERDDALVRASPANYASARSARYPHGLSEERNYERPGHYYERVPERESYMRRPLTMGYHEEDSYQGRAKSRDRYVRSAPGNTYTEGTERNQTHFRAHNTRQHFDQPRYPVNDQYSDERDVGATTPRLNRRTNNATGSLVVPPTVASPPPPARSESRQRRAKRRSRSRTLSGSRSNSRSRSRSRSTSGSRSSSSSSKLRSSSSESSGRSRSPSKSRSPATSYGSQSNAKNSRLDRPTSAIANPSNTTCYLPSTVTSSAINCTLPTSQGTITNAPTCAPASSENASEKDEKKPLGICVRNLPVRSTDTSLKDGLFHEYKKHGKVTMVKVIGQGTERYAVVCFKKPEDVDKALEVSKDKLFFGCKIEVTAHEGLDAEDNEFRPLEAELDEFHPKATRTLFIGNLEKDITTAELRKHFEQFGEIIEIDIKKQGSATSYAFIQYSDIASVVKAMRKLDGENLGANRIKLGFGKSMPTNCVWLDGIVDTISEKFLARHFSRFGLVAYAAIDREKGHALVFYDSVEFAQIAVSEMRGRILGGKKLQVDFASRECQTTFFDKLEMTGQMVPGDRPWERRERRGAEFEIIRSDDRYGRDGRVNFDNRAYTRYDGQPRPTRGNFRGIQRSGFGGRGRGQNFSTRYEVYHDEFGERRHRYNSREENTSEGSFDGKLDRVKYGDATENISRKRNKLRNSISDQESHHSQSPPRSRHQSRSTSPVSKERKSLKDKLHHRVKSPGSHNSSQVSSPCRESAIEEPMDIANDYREFRQRSELKTDSVDISSDLTFTLSSPKNFPLHDALDKTQPKTDIDLFRRRSVDSEVNDETSSTSEQLSQLERKRRLLASAASVNKDINLTVSKSINDRSKLKATNDHVTIAKPNKINCVSDICDDVKSDIESGELQEETGKEKPPQTENANPELKHLQKKQIRILHLLEQLQEGVNSSDTEGDSERPRKKQLSLSCIDTNENDISKAVAKDRSLCTKTIKTENVDSNNCISLSLDSFVLRKHLDPRKGILDPQTLSSINSLQKYRRLSLEKDDILVPNNQVSNDTFVCVPASVPSDVSWKKHNTLNDSLFLNNDDELLSGHYKLKDESATNDCVRRNSSTSSSLPLELPKSYLSMRAFSDASPCHEIKRERDISPLSLPLPKFAASLRSPKSSPSVLTSPKSSAHSPRAGHSPSSFTPCKPLRIPELLQDIQNEKKKDTLIEEKINGANISPLDAISPLPTQLSLDTSEVVPCLEPIQSPKLNSDKNKDVNSSSDSDFSPVSSPNRPSIEDRIKALDEKFNAWSGSTRTSSGTANDPVPPPPTDFPKCIIKNRSRFNFLGPDIRSEPSEIVKSLLAKSTIFDQDSKRLQHIDEKYEPLNIKVDLSPKIKPTFRTKAAAKEFSSPILPSLQAYGPSVQVKSSLTPQPSDSSPASLQCTVNNNTISSIASAAHGAQVPPQLLIQCPPHIPSVNSAISRTKSLDDCTVSLCKDSGIQAGLALKTSNTVKPKVEIEDVKHVPSTLCSVDLISHATVPNSVPVTVKRELITHKENIVHVPSNENESKLHLKNELLLINSSDIPLQKDCTVTLVKDQTLIKNAVHSFDQRKDVRIVLHENNPWKEGSCKETSSEFMDTNAKGLPVLHPAEPQISVPAIKKRVSSIDSSESDSGKSYKSLESSRESQEVSSYKQEKLVSKIVEPEVKKPKLSSVKNERERSPTPVPVPPASTKKYEKKEKNTKGDRKNASNSKINVCGISEKEDHDTKVPNKNEAKDKKLDGHKSREEKRNKNKDSKDSSSKTEQKTKSRERRNSEKDNKNSLANSKNKKEHNNNKSEKPKTEKKQAEKKSSSKSKIKSELDIFIEEEPVYFSMYDKVKARSSKTQTLKHQAKDLETMRQKFSKLKQSRAKREEKSKSVDQDSEKDSDTPSHHSSDSDTQQTKTSTKTKQQRKRKLVIESSSDDDFPEGTRNRASKKEKDFSDSASDSESECKVQQKTRDNNHNTKNKKKKTDVIESDSSDSESRFVLKSQPLTKKKMKSKHSIDKFPKASKSNDENSDIELPSKVQSKEKDHRKKKTKREKIQDTKCEKDNSEFVSSKKIHEDGKVSVRKKITRDDKHDSETTFNSSKREEASKDKSNIIATKEKKCNPEEAMEIDEPEKLKSYNKKKKKSKKASRNKEKRPSADKNGLDFSRKDDETESKSSIPVLLSPKPTSPMLDKPLSPPCLQAGNVFDVELKSDVSDLEYDCHRSQNPDPDSDMLSNSEAKTEKSAEKLLKGSKKKDFSFSFLRPSSNVNYSDPEKDSCPPLLQEKIVNKLENKDTNSKTNQSLFATCGKKSSQSTHNKKEKETSDNISFKHRSEKHEINTVFKIEDNKSNRDDTSHSKEDKRKKKIKKQYKEKRKTKDDSREKENPCVNTVSTSAAVIFEPPSPINDSRLSDIRLDEEIAEEARRLEQELLAASEETSNFGEENTIKREDKQPLERRFEEEAAKETQRLEEELFSTGREAWHMKEKTYGPESNVEIMCGSDKQIHDLNVLAMKDENIFAGLDLHTAMGETSQNENDIFLTDHSGADQYKLEDKDANNEIEDQRKIEDDLAVSALLQEMNSGEISAPELTKETDYLDPLINTHPDDTMSYLLPDEGENSLHIVDNSPEPLINENQEEKFDSSEMLLSPASNSEPPALEISNVEDPTVLKDEVNLKINPSDTSPFQAINDQTEKNFSDKNISYDVCEQSNTEASESKPPVIDFPVTSSVLIPCVDTVPSKSLENKKVHRKNWNEKSKPYAKENMLSVSHKDESDEMNDELSDSQLVDFEDITMDTTDSKDNDNPPVLLPVDLPHAINSSEKDNFEELSNEKQNEANHFISSEPEASTVVNESVIVRATNICKDHNVSENIELEVKVPEQDISLSTSELSDLHSDLTHLSNINLPNNNNCVSSASTESENEIISNTVLPGFEKINNLEVHSASDIKTENACVKSDDTCSDAPNAILSPESKTKAYTSSYSDIIDAANQLPFSQSVIQKPPEDKPNPKQSFVSNENDMHNSVLDNERLSDINIPDTIECKEEILEPVESIKNDKNVILPTTEVNNVEKHPEVQNNFDFKNITHIDINIPSKDRESELNTSRTGNEAATFNNLFVPVSDALQNSQICSHLPIESSFSDPVDKSSQNNADSSLDGALANPGNEKRDNQNDITYLNITEKMNSSPVHLNSETEKITSLYPASDISDSLSTSLCKGDDDKMEYEENCDKKTKSVDVESVSSDTTDITYPDGKTEMEICQLTSGEEQVQEDVTHAEVEDVEGKPKTDRPRRGRRPKTRKHLDSASTAPKSEIAVESYVNPPTVKGSSRRIRPTSSERVRRSLRTEMNDHISSASTQETAVAVGVKPDNANVTEQEERSGHLTNEETSCLVIDTAVGETDCSLTSSEATTSIDTELKHSEKIQHSKNEEPKRRRGRKKKTSGGHQTSVNQLVDKTEVKAEDHVKDFHRPKKSRFWLSLLHEKEQKSSKDNSSTVDVFEFHESEDEELTFERNLQSTVKDRLHDTSKSATLSPDQKLDVKIDAIAEKEKNMTVDKEKSTAVEKEKNTTAEKEKNGAVEKERNAVSEKEKRAEEKQKGSNTDEKEVTGKEYTTEVNQHRKISITIRLHQKDGQDGISAGTAEVVKTSEALSVEELKTESSKSEKNLSGKQESNSNEVPYNGPSKSTRKSTRLMNQAMRSTVDEVIEEVVKRNCKSHSSAQIESMPTRVTRRSRAARRSEESLSALSTDTLEDTAEEKNKNEPVFFILDNTVKEVSDTKKLSSNPSTDTPPVTESSNSAEPDRITDRIASLRSFRITRSAASKLEANKDTNSNLSFTGAIHDDKDKKENVSLSHNEEKKENTVVINSSKNTEKENTHSLTSETITYRPPLPVLKVELPRMILPCNRETVNKPEKGDDNDDDSDSRSSPTVLIDPRTGFLMPVHKNTEHATEMVESNVVTSTSEVVKKSESNSNSSSVTRTVEVPSTVKEEKIQNKLAPCDFSHTTKSSVDTKNVSGSVACIAKLPSAQKVANLVSVASSEVLASLDTLSALEREVEDLKASVRKVQTCTRVGVLTSCSTTSSVITTSAFTTTANSVANTQKNVLVSSASNQASELSYGWPADSVVKSSEKSALQACASSNVPQTCITATPPYQSAIKTIVTAVVTLASSGLVTNLPLKTHTKCSQSTGTNIATAVKAEASTAHTVSLSSASLAEVASCSSVTSTSNSYIAAQHSASVSSKNSMSPTAVSTTWSNVKPSSGNCVTSMSDVTRSLTIQTTAPLLKSESARSGPSGKASHSHSSKPGAAFLQSGFSISAYDAPVHSGAHNLTASNNGGVIAELLQNPQLLQQHKEYFATTAASSGQFQERTQNQTVRPSTPVASGIPSEVSARLGNPTPPHTPTPPVSSANHSLQPSDLHGTHVGTGLHLRHPTQPPLIVPPHPAAIGIHPSDLNAYVHQQIIYAATHPHYAAVHPELRAQQEAQARAAAAMGISPRFAYPPIPPTAVASGNFRQPQEPRLPHSSSSEVKSERKSPGELSKVIHENRTIEDKTHHSVKPIRIKKEEKEMKVIHSDCREEHDSSRSGMVHEKHPSTTAVTPQTINLRQQHAHYSTTIRQMSPHLTVSPHERITDSPVVANLYATGQNRVPPIPVSGQIDDQKPDNSITLPQSQLMKSENTERTNKPPAAHQNHLSTVPYHNLDTTIHPATRQPILGVPQVGSPAPGYIDSRTSNQSSHSPSSHSYKKESSHSQTTVGISSQLHNVNDKRTNPEISKKTHGRSSSQSSSLSPGPAGLGAAHSPLPWPPVIQSHNLHHPVAQSPHPLLPNEQPSHRSNPHLGSQMGSDIPVHAPPPAHAMSQPTNIPRTLPQTPPHASQVPPHGDAFILQRYPVMWQGLLALKNDQAAVQMHFVSGNPSIARASLPPMVEGETAPVRIAQRMRLEQTQLEGVARKMQMMDEHCILMALPCGKDHMDVLQQSSNLKNGFINYLQLKQAAGIVNAAPPGSQQPAYVIHIFPSCDFSDSNLARIAPDLLHIICDITHLVIIIATV